MDLEKLVIKVMAETTDAQTKLNKIRDAANKTAQSANKGLGSIGKNSDGGLRKTLNQIKSINNAIKGFGRKIQLGTGMIKPTQGFKDLTVKIIDADTALEEFRQKLAAMDESDPNFSEMVAAVKEAEDVIEGMNEALNEAVADGSAFEDGWIGKVKSGLGKITSGAKSLLSHFPRIGGAARAARGGVDSLFKGLRGVWTIAKTIAIGAGITGWINATKQGFSNLAAYSASTRNSLDMLKSSLLTLKNAFATALAPLLDIVAPVLSAVIDWFTAAATAVAQLFSALTGKSVAIVARKATSGIDGVGSSASNAAGAVDDLKRSIMGFDQINKLDDNSSGGGGGGGGGGAGGAGSMFDTVEIDSGIKSLADAIKEAWQDADFTDLGRMVGEKLKAALDDIPWTEIQAVGAKIGKSIATGLNGFFSTPDLGTSIGNTIAQALNTVTITLDSFAVNFEWDTFGKFIGDSINGFFDTFQFKLAGKTISDFANGILTTLIEAIGTIKWENVGASVVDFIAGIEWGKLFDNASTLLTNIANALCAVLKGAINKAKEDIKEWLKTHDILDALPDSENLLIKVTFYQDLPPWLQKIIDFALENNPLKLSLNVVGYIADTVADIIGWFNGDTTDRTEMTLVARVIADISETFKRLWNWFTGGEKIESDLSVDVNGNVKKLDPDPKLNRDIDTNAKFTSSNNELTAEQRTFNSAAKFTSRSNNLTAAQRTFISKAKFTSRQDALTNKQKTISGITAKVTKVTGLETFHAQGTGVRFVKADGGVYKSGSWKPVTAAASGGLYNQGQMFIAREAGPELVGTIGGNTAVMNNDQIVSSVSAGVYKAVLSAMSQNKNGGGVIITLEGDAGKLFRVVRAEAQNYTRSTGMAAFPV